MTEALQKVVEDLLKLPPEEQDTMAAIIREELESERKWDELFASKESQELLSRMADQALAEDAAGETRPLEELLDSIDEADAD